MMKNKVLGIAFDDVGLARAVKLALMGTEPCFVVTPNAVMLEDCARVPEHRRLLSSASLILPDGTGVLRAAKRAGTPFLHGRVAGIDFGNALLKASAARGERIFLLGGADGVAQSAKERLQARFPRLRIVGAYWGYFDRFGEENRVLIGTIRACRPTVLLVCLGYPAQEEWISANLPLLPTVRVAAGLGGSIDVWAGKCVRAPHPVQAAGLEWAWRMLLEPRRLQNLPALLRFERLTRQTAAKNDGILHRDPTLEPQVLNNCYENDNFQSKPL